MRKMKRFLAILLSASMLLSSESLSVFATETADVTDTVAETVVETTEEAGTQKETLQENTSEDEVLVEEVLQEETQEGELVLEESEPEETEIQETTIEEILTEPISEPKTSVEEVSNNNVPEVVATVVQEPTVATPPATGYIALPREDETSAVRYDLLDNGEFPQLFADSLPSSYQTPNLPAVRNQNPYGTCWSFSSIGLAEIDLMQHGVSAVDLSELQLAYFSYYSVVDPLGGTTGDSNQLHPDCQSNFLQQGGNLMLASRVLAGWTGYVPENTVPYEDAATVLSKVNNDEKGLDDSLAYEADTVHLKNAYYINIKQNPEIVKAMIQEYGAVGTAYYQSNTYYNSTNKAYYVSAENTGTNHAVIIVGWDDNYSKDNFNTAPATDGAWLIRNSWGESDTQEYFWLSYCDKSLDTTAYVFDVTMEGEDDFYDNNYQYDGSMTAGYLRSTDYITAANVFTAKSGAETELLKAVSFETSGVNQSYTIQVYKGLSDATNPESGALVATETGECIYEGIYSVELSNPVSLNQGETFAIVVTISAKVSGGLVYLDIESDTEYAGWFLAEASACAGQSYLDYGSDWQDAGAAYGANICIKAYTTDVKEAAPVTGIVASEESIELGLGEQYQLSAQITPSDASNHNKIWSSSDESIVTVDASGKVTAHAYGEAVITVKSQENEALYDTIAVQVTNTKVTSISLNKSELELILNEQETLTVSYQPDTAVPSGSVTWSSSAPRIASVDASGKVSAVGYGYCMITATADGKEASCTVYVFPEAPVLEAHYIDDGRAALTWNQEDDILYYEVYRYDSATARTTLISDPLPESGFVDDTLQSNVRYMYYVKCYAVGIGSNYAMSNRSNGAALTYHITYELGGGTNSGNNPTEFSWNEEKFSLEDPQHDTAVFEGWYYDSAYTKKVEEIDPYRTLDNLMIYAKWRYRQVIQPEWLMYSAEQDYTGAVFEPTVQIKNGDYTLVEGTDYEVTRTNPTTASCQLTVTGIGEYIGSQTVTIQERQVELQDDMLTPFSDRIYTGRAHEPNPRIVFNGTVLTLGTDYSVGISGNLNAGTAHMTIYGIGHFKGEIFTSFTIRTKTLEKSFVTAVENQAYTGSAIEPDVTLTYNNQTLQENVDYTVAYSNNTEVGTAQMIVKGKGNYVGTLEIPFEIVSANLEALDETLVILVEGSELEYSPYYVGELIEPEVSVALNNGTLLIPDVDYTVSYAENMMPGEASIFITGKGNYAGTVERNFTIREYSIEDASVTLGRNLTVLYAPSGQKPVPRVEHNGKRLVEGRDFVVAYYPVNDSNVRTDVEQAELTDAGRYEVVLKGIGVYAGVKENAAFVQVKPRALDMGTVEIQNPYARIDGEIVTAKYQLWYRNYCLEADTDYRVSYTVSQDKLSVLFVFEGLGNYSGTMTQRFPLIAADVIVFSEGEYKISDIEAQTYTGTAVCPTIHVVSIDETKELTEGVDYKVSYKRNVNVGTATVTITGIGDCVGTLKKNFTIIPKDAAMGGVEVEAADARFTYLAKVQVPKLSVYSDFGRLKEGTDYTVTYTDTLGNPVVSKNAGSYQAVVTLQGNYTGTLTYDYEISQKSVSELNVVAPDYIYTGSDIVPSVSDLQILLDGKALSMTEKAGLSVSSNQSNINAAMGNAYLNGSGNYTGQVAFTFYIQKKDIHAEDVRIEIAGEEVTSANTGCRLEWTGAAQTLNDIRIYSGNVELTQDVDYTLVYRYNTDIGTARVIIIGKNNYQGEQTLFFEIVGKTLSEENGCEIFLSETEYVYDATAKMPLVTVKKDGEVLEEGVDYSLFYSNNINAGTAKVVINGMGSYTGTMHTEYTILPKTAEDAESVAISNIARQRYTRNVITPEVTITMDGVKLVKGKDYTVTVLNGINQGVATFVATGIGNYSGVLAEKQFEIYWTTITYVMNGGENSESNPTYYAVTDNITFVNPKERDAYNFAGWYSDKACTKRVYGVSAGTNGNLTFYAKWTPKQVNGIDVSYHQGTNKGTTIDWATVSQTDKTFAMIRICQGTRFVDVDFEENYLNARANGIKVGVYCYSEASSVEEARQEADYVLRELKGKKLDYPIAIDMESVSSVEGLTKAQITDIAYAFKDVVESAGYDFILYANLDWMKNKFENSRLAPLDLWLARYRSYELGHGYYEAGLAGDVRIWQYSSKGSVSGIKGNVDLNVCYEDYVRNP